MEVEAGFQDIIKLVQHRPPCMVSNICCTKPLFSFVNFCHVNSISNKAAMVLATEVASSHYDKVWLKDFLDTIIFMVQSNIYFQ